MSKYVFPAVFTPEGEFYVVDFPDIPNCYTQGEGLNDALEMANEVLCLTLYHMEKEGKTIPLPSDIHDIKINENNSFVSLVGCDTFEYQKFYEKKSIKKTLTIPQWLNTAAEQNHINFSAVLQTALMEKLGLA